MQKNRRRPMSRVELISLAQFPVSNYERIVARIKSDGVGYVEQLSRDQQFYVTSEYIGEYKATIRQLNRTLQKIYCEKRKKDEYDFLRKNIKVVSLIVLCVFVGFFIL